MKLFYMFSLLLLTFACKKAEDRTCFKSIGKTDERIVDLPAFEKLILREHMVYVLVEDTVDKLIITGGKNLIKHISWSVDDQKVLELRNVNKCNFTRKMGEKIKVEIHYKNMYNIHFEGTDSLTNIGTLTIPYFTLMVRDGSGSVNLKLNSIRIDADISHGWGDYTFSGKTNYAKIGARSNGYCDVQNLKVTDSIYVYSETSGNIKLNADSIPLFAELKGNGNIYYWGNPSSITVKELSKGKLLEKQ